VRTYHIKDALKQDAASLGLQPRAIEDAITNDSDLAVLADLANLDKHFKLNKSCRSGAVPEIVAAEGVRWGSGEGGWRLKTPIAPKPCSTGRESSLPSSASRRGASARGST
jgi:hypothetical protein